MVLCVIFTLQKVLEGNKTIEGFVSGSGILTVIKEDGGIQNYNFNDTKDKEEVIVKVNEIMQWEASGNSDLIFYEICYPPYKAGRYENLSS